MEDTTSGVAQLKLNPISWLFKESWKLYTERLSVFLEIVLVPVLIIVLGYVLIFTGSVFAVLGALIVIIGFIVFTFSVVPLIHSIHHGSGVDESYKVTIPRFWPLIWIVILQMLAFAGGMLMLIIPGIWLGVALSLSVYIFVVERRRGVDALRQSKDYLKGYWWAYLGRSILLALIIIVLDLVVQLPIALFAGRIIAIIIWMGIILFFTPFSAIYHYLIYRNLQELKPELVAVAAETKKGATFIKVAAIVGIAAMVLWIVLVATFIGLAKSGALHADMAAHQNYYYPPSSAQ